MTDREAISELAKIVKQTETLRYEDTQNLIKVCKSLQSQCTELQERIERLEKAGEKQ